MTPCLTIRARATLEAGQSSHDDAIPTHQIYKYAV